MSKSASARDTDSKDPLSRRYPFKTDSVGASLERTK